MPKNELKYAINILLDRADTHTLTAVYTILSRIQRQSEGKRIKLISRLMCVAGAIERRDRREFEPCETI